MFKKKTASNSPPRFQADTDSWHVKNIPIYENESELSQEEITFRAKKQKRAEKVKRKEIKRARRGEAGRQITNYTIVRYRSEGYTSLRGLNVLEQIAMTVRYLIDKKYREEGLKRRAAEQAEQRLRMIIKLRKFILTSLEKIPPNSSTILQIDNMFTPVLETVLKTTLELQFYDFNEIKINPNYKRYIRKIHPLIEFIPLPEYKSKLVQQVNKEVGQ